jgi:uncharacterized membrane protein YbaN (DUF454 family)
MRTLVEALYLSVGTLAVVLGIIGIFLPVLPTTPFLLLAAFCYARSSDRFYQWLITNRWFGKYIKDYREGKGIPRREKVLTLTMLWLTIGFAAIFTVSAWWGKLILIAVACGVTLHVVRLKTSRLHDQDTRVADQRETRLE